MAEDHREKDRAGIDEKDHAEMEFLQLDELLRLDSHADIEEEARDEPWHHGRKRAA